MGVSTRIAMAVLLASIMASRSHAAVLVTTDTGVVHTTAALTGFATTGAMMDGMLVTAFFSDGSSEAIAWADTAPSSGGALGTGWSLIESGDTFGGIWTLANSTLLGMTRLLINGVPGDTIFDVSITSAGAIAAGSSNPGGAGSPGSANGWTFDLVSGPASLDITATYRNILQIGASAPVGDLWTTLDLEFTSGLGLGSLGVITFRTDTDSAAAAGDITPTVPEPVSLAIWGLGALGCAVGAYRRRMRS